MSAIISDGKGKGYKAGVTDAGRLETRSITTPVLAYTSAVHAGSFWLGGGPFTGFTAATETPVIWGKNISGDKTYFIDNIRVAWNGGTTNRNRNMLVSFYVGSDAPTTNYATVPSSNHKGNLNLGSQIVPEMDIRFWDGVGTGMVIADTGAKFITELLPGQQVIRIPTEMSLIMPPASIILMTCTAEEDGNFTASWMAAAISQLQ